jgi:uncharacterized protein YgiM (DUF1202 family)
MDRRRMLRLIGGAGAAAAVGTLAVAGAARAQDEVSAAGGFYVTTTALNLRAKPSTSAKVLRVMPARSAVEYLGETRNGFRKVAYKGIGGWAHKDYLQVANGGSDDPPVIIGQAVTAIAVNFRTGPSTGHRILRVLAAGTVVQISDTKRDGFRYVVHNGQGGWIYDDYLAPQGGEGPAIFVTTTAVNLRAQPSTSAKVLKVVPKGATVKDYDLVMSNGFRGVDYNGTVGWIYDAYLTR